MEKTTAMQNQNDRDSFQAAFDQTQVGGVFFIGDKRPIVSNVIVLLCNLSDFIDRNVCVRTKANNVLKKPNRLQESPVCPSLPV